MKILLVESYYKPSKHVVILTHDNPNNSTTDIYLYLAET